MKSNIISICLIVVVCCLVTICESVCTQRQCGILNSECGANSACAPGYYCVGGTCQQGKLEGKSCDYSKGCALGLKCDYYGGSQFKICKPLKYQGLNKECRNSIDCLGNLQCIENVCSKVAGGNCTVHEDCEQHAYCNIDNQCVNRLSLNSDCIFNQDLCTFDSICSKVDGRSNYLAGKCAKMFSKVSGESCFAQYGECNQNDGLFCPSNTGYTSTCTKLKDNVKKCNSSSDCDKLWQSCECTGTISNSTCQLKFNIDNQCSQLYVDLQSCLSGHSCSVVNDIGSVHELYENACNMKYCKQESLCFYSRCLKKEFGNCVFPDNLQCKQQGVFTNFVLKSRTGKYTDGLGPDAKDFDELDSNSSSSSNNSSTFSPPITSNPSIIINENINNNNASTLNSAFSLFFILSLSLYLFF